MQPWLTVLSTRSRPQYLHGTLEGLDGHGGAAAFKGSKLVMFDGVKGEVTRPGWDVQQLFPSGEQCKQTRSFIAICKRAVEADCPYLLYFEDDVFPSRNAVLAMDAMEVPSDLAFLTFCNQKTDCEFNIPHIEARRADAPANYPGHWGCQAMKLPRRTLEFCARWNTNFENDALFVYYDIVLGQRTASRSRNTYDHYYGIVLPSLIRHTGQITTVESQKKEKWEGHRLGLNYAGDESDGLAIARQIAVNGVKMWSKNGG